MRRVLLPHHFSQHPAPARGTVRDFRGLSMGTSWSVRLVAPADAAPDAHLQEGMQQQLDIVVAQMSHWYADSSLSRFNRGAAGTWHTLPAEFFEVLAFALEVARASGGAYDPGIGALINRWGFGPGGGYALADFAPPTPAEVAALLAQGRGRIELDTLAHRARQPGATLLDLSAVAKGHGVDRVARYLEGQGVRHYLVEVGGELRGAGSKPDGQPWWVALEQAETGPGDLVLALHGLAVATSGDYRRFFQRGARRYSHTLDPRSGAPIDNALASVTVVHAECMAADAWSTALTVLGAEAGLALADRLGLAARFLERDGAGLRERLSLSMRRMLQQ
ncbi:MAG TPA: thiamine biosynthesis protein ApbE [Janthinobacterium sp.]|nr:thiamine biosynthesis protein ApbE [Janthinobacterium sp.]